jgi:nitrogen regulatory protein PII
MTISNTLKLLTIITESALENTLVQDLDQLGVTGYTISDARGKGTHGIRGANWDANSNVRIEVICCSETAEAIAVHVQKLYYNNYAMMLFMTDVTVLRPAKFQPATVNTGA